MTRTQTRTPTRTPTSAPRSIGCFALALALIALPSGCGEDSAEVTNQRGLGGASKIKNAPAGGKPAAGSSRRSASAPPGSNEPQGPIEDPDFERPKRATLTGDDFSGRSRDPFHNYQAAEVADLPLAVEVVRKQRTVQLAEYTFDELKLIAIVNAGRSVAPRALFLSSDNKSKTIKQGEYFSSAEVLLASVNRDYIEVEVIDPELTPGWNLERGERKVIYLKKND
jgi:Tfp pilus assembly protein PilP